MISTISKSTTHLGGSHRGKPDRPAAHVRQRPGRRHPLIGPIAAGALIGCGIVDAAFAQSRPQPTDAAGRTDSALAAIRGAARAGSQVERTVSYLADVVGPRLMGTPAYHRAATWAADALRSWGADSVHLESFASATPGYRGWQATSYEVALIGPTKVDTLPLLVYPQAYTASTPGKVTGEAVLVTSDSSARALVARRAGALRGKILLLASRHQPDRAPYVAFASGQRYTAEELRRAAENPDPNDVLLGYHSRRSTLQAIAGHERRRRERAAFMAFCREQGVLALLEPSDAPNGILHADGNGQIPAYSRVGDVTPVAAFVVSREHFGRLVRMAQRGDRPQLLVQLATRFHDNPEYHVNVLAELRGRDSVLRSEVVMLGAHLDSWHGGTGAADNAAGVSVMMEAMRLIEASGLRPRRTIRLALWGGEEQGFAGSRAYVARHIGDLATGAVRDGHARLSAYLNLDNGAGRIRGVYAMGNLGAATVFRDLLEPFPGDNTVTLQNANQTDHELFDALNIPAFQFIQDPLGYIPLVHHTNLDVADYVPATDLRASAELMAYVAYRLAERDSLIPRKPYVSVQPSRVGRVVFRFPGRENAEAVHLVGDFNTWGMFGTPLARVPGGWECRLDLPPGRYVYKFIVDGDWTSDPATPAGQLVKDGKGHSGLTVRVVR
jgi:carboxypeptidase Q